MLEIGPEGLDKIFSELAEGVGDQGLAVEVVGAVEGLVAGFFLGGEGGVEFAGGDLFGGGVDEAELASGEVGFGVLAWGAHGRAECSAEDRAGGVEAAGAGSGVWEGAGFGVAEAFYGVGVGLIGE